MTGSDAPEDIKRAKKTNPTAYLLKPIDKRSLEISIDLALYNYYPTLMSEGDMTMHIANKRNSTKFFLKNGDVIFLKQSYHFVKLPIEDIIYLEADGNYTKIITAQQKFLVRLGISTVLEQFNADYLIKINRAQAINIRHLLSFNEVDITLIGKKEFALSKAYKENFLAKFETL